MAIQGVQPAQQVSLVPATYANFQRPPGPALTVFEGDRVILSGGIASINARHGVLWAVLSPLAGRHMLFLHRGVKRFIDCQPVKRLEATTELGFWHGCRWLKLLGFKYEGKMPGFGDAGETHLRFGMIR